MRLHFALTPPWLSCSPRAPPARGMSCWKAGKTLPRSLGRGRAVPQQIPMSSTKISGTVLLPAWSWKTAPRGHLLHTCPSLPSPIGDTRRWRRAGAVGQSPGRKAVGWSSGVSCQHHAYLCQEGESSSEPHHKSMSMFGSTECTSGG